MSAASGGPARSPAFGDFVAEAQRAGELVVQPRMGMSSPRTMRAGLLATKRAIATTVGTITLDSYTRVGDNASARAAVAAGAELNGYPIVAHDVATTRGVLDGIVGPDFPVQVRHGSPCPEDIFTALMAAGLHATEGGPVSYCLPYSREPLDGSIQHWIRSCRLLARLREAGGPEPHLETFGGCMMGQLCPPSLLIAMSVLECMFFRQHGLRSVSLSYAQQTSPDQDAEAVLALRRLAAEWLPGVDWHIVIYAYMGVYPRTPDGATMLLTEAARLAVRSSAARLIVKTVAEAYRIPSIADNIGALETAAAAAAAARREPPVSASPEGRPPGVLRWDTSASPGGRSPGTPRLDTSASPGGRPPGTPRLDTIQETGIYAEASALIEAVAGLRPDLGGALADAFAAGYLDVPYCLHPDNARRTRSFIDTSGRLQWSSIGSMPIHEVVRPSGSVELTAAGLLASLSYVERKFDNASLGEYRATPVQATGGA